MSLGAVFPGQGAQSVGMLAELANAYPSVEARFAQASEVLGFDAWQMAQNGPAEDLSATQNTQPLLLTASVAVWDVWQQHAPPPSCMAGHSLGEYSALCCAGTLQFEDAIALVRLRGELMEAAVPRGQGSMAAVMGLTDDEVRACCDQVDGVVVAANFNAPGQVVIAGEAQAVELAAARCKDSGAKRALVLDVSGPFHSPLMAAARDELGAALMRLDLRMPDVPVIQNVTARVPQDLEELKANLLTQVAAPVLWTASVHHMLELGVEQFAEVGPGSVLAGLIRRISKGTPTRSLASPESIQAATSAA